MRVVVLGAGIVGLWTAEVLSARGHDVTVRMTGAVSSSTSAAAVAVITPLFPGKRDDPGFQRSISWYRKTLDHLVSLHDGDFVEWIPACEFGITIDGKRYLEKDFQIDKFADVGLAVEYVDVEPSVTVENHVGQTHEITFGARFLTPLCNSENFLPWLASQLRTRGVRFATGLITSLQVIGEQAADIYVNCLGFQSSTFFPDPDVWTVRGQSMFLPVEPNPAPHFGIAAGNHAIFRHRRGFYFGSYFIEGEPEPRPVPSKIEYELSRRFAAVAYPKLCAVAGYEVPRFDLDMVARVNSGIRPFRHGGPRIAFEVVDGMPFVHHYGHGAHGWTIGYGTALDVADLVEEHVG